MIEKTILVVEDEQAIQDMLRFILEPEGFQVDVASNVATARQLLGNNTPSLILLDWMLPGTSGLEFARQLKKDAATAHIPIIMLTARGDELDRVRGLEMGADDYVTKPFSTRELLARIKAVLRRAAPHMDEAILEIEGLQLDPLAHRVTVEGHVVELGPTEFLLLHFFMSHPDRVYSRTQLLDQVWGINVAIEERTVDVYMRRLRKALEPHQRENLLQTVRGTGYRLSRSEP